MERKPAISTSNNKRKHQSDSEDDDRRLQEARDELQRLEMKLAVKGLKKRKLDANSRVEKARSDLDAANEVAKTVDGELQAAMGQLEMWHDKGVKPNFARKSSTSETFESRQDIIPQNEAASTKLKSKIVYGFDEFEPLRKGLPCNACDRAGTTCKRYLNVQGPNKGKRGMCERCKEARVLCAWGEKDCIRFCRPTGAKAYEADANVAEERERNRVADAPSCSKTEIQLGPAMALKPELVAAIEAFKNQAQQMLDQMGMMVESSKV